MTQPTARQIAARKRAAEQKRLDPMFFKRRGALGGSVSGISKGIATMSLEQRKEFSQKGVEARRIKKDMVKPDGE